MRDTQHILVSIASALILAGSLQAWALGAETRDTPDDDGFPETIGIEGRTISRTTNLSLFPPAPPEPAAVPMRFGIDVASVDNLAALGAKPDFGTIWIGAWLQWAGWEKTDRDLVALRDANVTPLVQFYYWGDDISVDCFQAGCWSSRHGTLKTHAGWEATAVQLTFHLNATLAGAPVWVILESEFNKGGIAEDEGFDAAMAEVAETIHAGYPAATVVLGFGNWGADQWSTFDLAVAASDVVGLQGMAASTRGPQTDIEDLYNSTLSSAQQMTLLFQKPILLTDIAVSTYPAEASRQAEAVDQFLSGIAALKAAGVQGIVYRTWPDNPNMDTANYFGPAERHWGLADAAGQAKPAGEIWVAGVLAERASPADPE